MAGGSSLTRQRPVVLRRNRARLGGAVDGDGRVVVDRPGRRGAFAATPPVTTPRRRQAPRRMPGWTRTGDLRIDFVMNTCVEPRRMGVSRAAPAQGSRGRRAPGRGGIASQPHHFRAPRCTIRRHPELRLNWVMSDRPARPEWRAAYLNRTLPRQALRGPSGRGQGARRLVGAAVGADAAVRRLPTRPPPLVAAVHRRYASLGAVRMNAVVPRWRRSRAVPWIASSSRRTRSSSATCSASCRRAVSPTSSGSAARTRR